MPAHKHAKSIKEYADDCQTMEFPYRGWQFRNERFPEWTDLDYTPKWALDTEYRRKPFANYSASKFPAPLTNIPEHSRYMYVASPLSPSLYVQVSTHHTLARYYVNVRMAHESAEAAIKHATALISFSGGCV